MIQASMLAAMRTEVVSRRSSLVVPHAEAWQGTRTPDFVLYEVRRTQQESEESAVLVNKAVFDADFQKRVKSSFFVQAHAYSLERFL